MSVFSQRLKEVREQFYISQNNLAKRLAISPSMAWRYENGTSEPTLEVILKLASFFSVSVDYLVGLTDEKRGLAHFEGILEAECDIYRSWFYLHHFDIAAIMAEVQFIRSVRED